MEPPFIKSAEQLGGKFLDKAIENPLEAIRTTDAILSIAAKVLPTLPWETPFPIPRGVYEQLKVMGEK